MNQTERDSHGALLRYYAERASEYERIYRRPERQPDLRRLESTLPELFRGRRVLEIACGTGYWTRCLASAAQSIVALDANVETLEIARSKALPATVVDWQVGDAYALPESLGSFDAAFAGFWWSHVSIDAQHRFLESLDARLSAGARVVFLDNLYVEGNSSPIERRDAIGNTYQRRRLDDGSQYVILKNFPTDSQLRDAVAPFARETRYERLDYYWTFVWEK